MTEQRRRRGGPIGDRNVCKHGFDSRALTPEEQAAFPSATSIKSLDRAIAVARLRVKTIVANDPRNYEVLLRAFCMLARVLRLRQSMDKTRRGLSQVNAELLDWFVSRLIPESNSGSK